LSEKDIQQLDELIARWKQDPDKAIQIESHTDAEEQKGIYSYSAERSAAVARYLYDQGIPLDKMLISNWEFEKPVIDIEQNDCSEADRGQNRRSEVALIEALGLASEPNYIVTYEFDDWRLNQEAEKVVFQLLKELKETPSAVIRIDGFTDTWGSFESNERISELRANNLKNLLLMRGYSEKQLEVIYHGETIPRGPCILNYPCPLEERQENRRVEIRLK